MATTVLDYTSEQLNRGVSVYTRDFVGSVRMLEDAGFSPFTKKSPLDSTISQVFSRFVEKTGIADNVDTLRNNFLEQYPGTQRALDLYSSLQNTFAPRGAGEKAAIVDFLNARIDDYISQKDKNDDQMLTLEESNFSESLFEQADADNDRMLNTDELSNNFFENYQSFNNVVNYFRRTTGNIINITG